jgi:hypothetical protein
VNTDTIALLIQALWPILTAIASIVVLAILYTAKQSWRIGKLEKDHDAHIALDLTTHAALIASAEKNTTTLWQKIDGLQQTMSGAAQSLSRLEGRFEGREQRDG